MSVCAPGSRAASHGDGEHAGAPLLEVPPHRRPAGRVPRRCRVDHDDRRATRSSNPCWSIQSSVSAAGAPAVEPGPHHQHELVGLGEQALVGAVEDAGAGVEQDQVVEAVEQPDQPVVVVARQGHPDAGVVVGGEHLEPRLEALRGVAPQRGVAS